MQIVSEEHFARMQMMCRYFKSQSETQELSMPEYQASKAINEIILGSDQDLSRATASIRNVLSELDLVAHKNDVHWYDYRLHVNAVLRENKFP